MRPTLLPMAMKMRMDCLWWRYDSYQASQLGTRPDFLAFYRHPYPCSSPWPCSSTLCSPWPSTRTLTYHTRCLLWSSRLANSKEVHTSEKCIQHLFAGGCGALRSWVFLLYFTFDPHGWTIPVGFSFSFDEQFFQSWSHLHFRQWYLMFTVVCTLVQMFHQLSWMVITMLRWIMSIILILLYQHKTSVWSCCN